MSADTLLSRLDRVTQHGTDRWRAICPAHESKHRTQSLAIRERLKCDPRIAFARRFHVGLSLGDGSLLVKCFAGCDAHAITAADNIVQALRAVGLEVRLERRGHYVVPIITKAVP